VSQSWSQDKTPCLGLDLKGLEFSSKVLLTTLLSGISKLMGHQQSSKFSQLNVLALDINT